MNDGLPPMPATLPDLSTAPPARLFTTWGTVLYVDSESGELRHGPIDTSPANAVFVAAPADSGAHRQGWIVHHQGDTCEPIVCLAERCVSVETSDTGNGPATATQLELVPLERGLIGLTADGCFLDRFISKIRDAARGNVFWLPRIGAVFPSLI